jgi:hypothetical protein
MIKPDKGKKIIVKNELFDITNKAVKVTMMVKGSLNNT